MARLKLYPSSGTIEDSRLLKFEISDVDNNNVIVHMENATHGSRLDINSFQDMGDGTYVGFVDLNIPAHSSQTAISIFAHIEQKKQDGSYETIQICPSIFTIKELIEKNNSVYVSPSFISLDDLCSISVRGNSGSSISVSVNDKIFKVRINQDGIGKIHFKGKDVVSDLEKESVSQFPIYLYKDDDNYVGKIFSGSYISILPSSISMHADIVIDPRCDENNEEFYVEDRGSWVKPVECSGIGTEIVNPIVPTVPPISVPTDCKEYEVISSEYSCKIFGSAATMLKDGTVLHAYLSPDNTYLDSDDNRFNINRVFLSRQDSSLSVRTFAIGDVVISPKAAGEDFSIYVDNDLWQSFSNIEDVSASDIYVILFNKSIGFQRIKIVDRSINEYTNDSILTGQMDGDNLQVDSWFFCVHAVFYYSDQSPDAYVSESIKKLPYVVDEDGNYIQLNNVSISNNFNYSSQYDDTYVYIVSEGIINGKSQLFFYSIDLPIDENRDPVTYGWKQLTTNGNNQNPRISMTSDHNLHIVWESDREDEIRQLYYGVLGLSNIPYSVSSLSSFIDKYSEFIASGEQPFDYLNTTMISLAAGDEYNLIPEYSSNELVNASWDKFSGDGGSITETASDNFINDLLIEGEAVKQQAIAFQHLQIVQDDDNPSEGDPIPYSQYNYQISFNLSSSISQESDLTSGTIYDGVSISDKDIDHLYNEWKSGFVATIEDNINNQPVYIKNNNRYVIGRRDNIFDKIVPFVGSYIYNVDPNDVNPSVEEELFQIKIMKEDNNLKDFTLGMMFEKSYFTATNLETFIEYSSHNYSDTYWPSETYTIYSGKARLVAFIKTEDISDENANYIIIREFPETFDVVSDHIYTIIMNYTAIDTDEVKTALNTYGQSYSNKFMGAITLLIDGTPKFSQSFISTLDSSYNYFDIGFGIPYGGYYVADKMSPNKLGLFDDGLVTMNFSDIEITSPTYIYNSDVVSMPYNIHNNTSLFVKPEVLISPWAEAVLIESEEDYKDEKMSIGYLGTDKLLYSGTWGEDVSEGWYDGSVSDLISFDTTSIDRIDFSIKSYSPFGSVRILVESAYSSEIFDSGYFYTRDISVDNVEYQVSVSGYDSVNVTIFSTNGIIPLTTINFYKVYESNTFSQVPLTISGINQSVDICNGNCDDVHIVWQSNRDRHWNIYYSNSSNKLSPFRRDTQITDTESNSLKPSISIGRNGSRMISWHDDRNGDFDIYMARSLNGYVCNEDRCEKKMLDSYKDNILECILSLRYEPAVVGSYNIYFEMYNDSGLSDLYKTIYLKDNPERWFINGSSVDDILAYNGEDVVGVYFNDLSEVTISYTPDQNDRIFDMVLYAKLGHDIL